MNQRYECFPCGIHRGEYAAKPNLLGSESVYLFLEFTISLNNRSVNETLQSYSTIMHLRNEFMIFLKLCTLFADKLCHKLMK